MMMMMIIMMTMMMVMVMMMITNLIEREEEVRILSARVAELQFGIDMYIHTIHLSSYYPSILILTIHPHPHYEHHSITYRITEIQSGAPQERRIFELAQSQSKREAMHR